MKYFSLEFFSFLINRHRSLAAVEIANWNLKAFGILII